MKTVNEVLNEVSASTNEKGNIVYNRFSKKNFNELLLAMANDVEFTENVVKKAGDDYCLVDEVFVTKKFRKWLKKVVEKMGIDSKESQLIMSNDFTIDSVDGLYEFFMACVYEYMVVGNRFEIPPHEDFKGSIYIKDVKEKKKNIDVRNPKDGTFMGTYEIKNKKHKVLATKSPCPTYLSEKRRIK